MVKRRKKFHPVKRQIFVCHRAKHNSLVLETKGANPIWVHRISCKIQNISRVLITLMVESAQKLYAANVANKQNFDKEW